MRIKKGGAWRAQAGRAGCWQPRGALGGLGCSSAHVLPRGAPAAPRGCGQCGPPGATIPDGTPGCRLHSAPAVTQTVNGSRSARLGVAVERRSMGSRARRDPHLAWELPEKGVRLCLPLEPGGHMGDPLLLNSKFCAKHPQERPWLCQQHGPHWRAVGRAGAGLGGRGLGPGPCRLLPALGPWARPPAPRALRQPSDGSQAGGESRTTKGRPTQLHPSPWGFSH